MSTGDLGEDGYATFLENLRECGHSFVFEMLNEDGSLIHIKYDGEEDDDDEEDHLIQTNGNHVKQEYDEEKVEAEEDQNMSFRLKHEEEKARVLQACVCDEYRKKLAEVLSKPFDLDEYKQLYNAATEHKYVQKDRILRSGTKVCDSNNIAPSYLNLYPDFKEQMKNAAFDPEECLRLMRGFFFWLKNLCHEGAFKPWVTKNKKKINEDCFVLED